MPLNAFSRDPLRVFSVESEGTIHRAAARLIERLGVRIDCDEALDLLEGYGVRCDRDRHRAYPDEASVQRALASVQRGYTVHGRGARAAEALNVGLDTVHTISGGAALKLYDGGRYRNATRQDMIDMIALHERLENVHIIINVVEPPEMAGPNLYPEMAALHFAHGSKPLLIQANGRRDLEKIIRMAELIAGGREQLRSRPIFMTGANAEPPLHITTAGAEVLTLAAREGIPCSLGSYAMAGSTGPLDVAGCIVQRTATVLCGLVLTQAARPGSPYDFSAQSGCCDLSNGSAVTMSPMTMQLVVGAVQLGRRYGMVTNAVAATDACEPDAQAAGERFFSLAVSVMAGASLVQGATGEMAAMELADFAQCVVDNEIAGWVLDFASGVGMDELDEAVSAIEDVVEDPEHSGYRFLGHPHTAARCRRGRHVPDLFSAGMLSKRMSEKAASLYEKAEARAQDLLTERREPPSPQLTQQLLTIAAEGPRQ